ncbi:hypothetical protein Psta_0701 [Pirellula staleyi DSM 6068]|uniref:Phospholipase C/D domain-containing protein n=1 Tax=Pirellula staleyi (strain ATCC 27377 / DSM 6068 / ICPB 4128) TaxID=530564 RepID=D2R5C8_PIRSD|nr:hypothetical protein [Pirellula staleyi]ADB15387.1 hypothetical protein Psta_0701 [Pirellula staleyi DSM 6068]
MNYLAHGWRFTADPYFLAGTSAPDWLSVIDRKVRMRRRNVEPHATPTDQTKARFARGVLQHLADDDWFHTTQAFSDLSWQFTLAIRDQLPADDGLRPSFLGHILVELMLDAALDREDPQRLDDYYLALAHLDPYQLQTMVSELATRPTDRLLLLLPRFLTERFLYDYRDDDKLFRRLEQVMRRVKLPPLPEGLKRLLPDMREAVWLRRHELLTPTSTTL